MGPMNFQDFDSEEEFKQELADKADELPPAT